MRSLILVSHLVVLAAIATTPPAAAQSVHVAPPGSREEALHRQRAEKARSLSPPKPSAAERGLLKLENDRFFERLLYPPEGIHPKIGHVTAGSSFSLGVGYRRPRLFGQRAVFSTFAMASFKRYWLLDARLLVPNLARGAAFLEVYGQRYDWPQEPFYGLGPRALRRDEMNYRLQNAVVGASAGVRLAPMIAVGGAIERMRPRPGPGTASGILNVTDRLEMAIPGAEVGTDFNHFEGFVDFNTREPLNNPRRGARYTVSYGVFDDVRLDRYGFRRLEIDLQQYISLLRNRRVIALRAFASTSDAASGQQVPFYMMRTLGGPDDLRGFRRHRFRDRSILLFQAEYRYEVMAAVDAAVFVDAGQVAPRLDDLALGRFEKDYGFGVRFGSSNGVFLRIEGAFGSRDGRHFILRFGNVF